MSQATLACQREERRQIVRNAEVYGLDYAEDLSGITDGTDGKPVFCVHFLGKAPKVFYQDEHSKNNNIIDLTHYIPNVIIQGGRRIRDLRVERLEIGRSKNPGEDDCMRVTLNKYGDLSTYTLCLVEVDEHQRPIVESNLNGKIRYKPLQGFDRRYACVEFNFRSSCPSNLDCHTETPCPPVKYEAPEIDYLAKDYSSFRQLILDRLSLIMPDWKERHVPDLGITLVEILAYAGDYLSYYQDAVATEAYLETARQRVSVRRHARLVDYRMHEGCNARALVCVEVMTGELTLPVDDVLFITGRSDGGIRGGTVLSAEELKQLPRHEYEIFEPMVFAGYDFGPHEILQPLILLARLKHDLASLENPSEAKAKRGKKVRKPANQGAHDLYQYIALQLKPVLEQLGEKTALADTDIQHLTTALNQLLRDETLIHRNFDQNKLSARTKNLKEQQPRDENLIRFNRWLLEDAYNAIPEMPSFPEVYETTPDTYVAPPTPREACSVLARNGMLYLYAAHNKIHFYTWGDRECCLPKGTTTATLWDCDPPDLKNPYAPLAEAPPRKLQLKVGDILIFEEMIGPKTGKAEDADPKHRHAVRLTKVVAGKDELINVPVIEIEWAAEDALPFPLCISTLGPSPECKLIEDISVACGNVILVDHGERIEEEVGAVEVENVALRCEGIGQLADVTAEPKPFRPTLQKRPLTCCEPLLNDMGKLTSVSGLLVQEPRQVLPQLSLKAIPAIADEQDDHVTYSALFEFSDIKAPGQLAKKLRSPNDRRTRILWSLLSDKLQGYFANWTDDTKDPPSELTPQLALELDALLSSWRPRLDLLSSGADDQHFVVETENDGGVRLRFGDGELGRKPAAGSKFKANYRISNGISGNIGAGMITHLSCRQTMLSGAIQRIRNPLPATGGIDPETLPDVKHFAPYRFRRELQRAISTADYQQIAERNPKLQRAAAALRWTGSWYEALVTVDPYGGEEASGELIDQLSAYLYRFRRMGHDLSVQKARYVPLDITLTVCVKAHYLRGHVEAELRDVLSNRILPDGRRGFFHPDNLSFGEGIYLSRIVAAAQAVEGVESVTVDTLQRSFLGPNHEIENGLLPLGPMEIAQLDNDPNYPENGRLVLNMGGGR